MYFYGLVCTFMYFTCTLLHQGNTLNCAIQYNQDGTKPFPHTKEILLLAKQGNMDPEPGFGICRWCPGCLTPVGGPQLQLIEQGGHLGEKKKVAVILDISFIVVCPVQL